MDIVRRYARALRFESTDYRVLLFTHRYLFSRPTSIPSKRTVCKQTILNFHYSETRYTVNKLTTWHNLSVSRLDADWFEPT